MVLLENPGMVQMLSQVQWAWLDLFLDIIMYTI